jgi:hypothetical protein
MLACAETLHGIARTVYIVPRLGKEKALKLSVVTGSALAFAICLFLVPGIGLTTTREHLLLGLGLAGFMAAFDIAIGKLVMRKPWRKIWPDFNPATGNYLVFGLAFLVFAPWLAVELRAHA